MSKLGVIGSILATSIAFGGGDGEAKTPEGRGGRAIGAIDTGVRGRSDKIPVGLGVIDNGGSGLSRGFNTRIKDTVKRIKKPGAVAKKPEDKNQILTFIQSIPPVVKAVSDKVVEVLKK